MAPTIITILFYYKILQIHFKFTVCHHLPLISSHFKQLDTQTIQLVHPFSRPNIHRFRRFSRLFQAFAHRFQELQEGFELELLAAHLLNLFVDALGHLETPRKNRLETGEGEMGGCRSFGYPRDNKKTSKTNEKHNSDLFDQFETTSHWLKDVKRTCFELGSFGHGRELPRTFPHGSAG